MIKKFILALALCALPLKAMAQNATAIGPLPACSAFGTTTGTCLQGSAAGKPYFRVQRITSNFTVGTQTVVQFNSTIDDSGSYWDGTNFRYTPGVAGRYLFSTCIANADSAIVSGTTVIVVYLFKNGTRVTEVDKYPSVIVSGAADTVCYSTNLTMNGSTDYVDVRVTNTGTNPAVGFGTASDQVSWFEGAWLGPQ